MKLVLTLVAAASLLTACAGTYLSTDGGKRATPGAQFSGAQYSQGERQ